MRLNRMIGGRTVAAVVAVAFGVLVGGASANAAEPLRVGKGFPSLFQFTPLDVGVEKGIFKKHGLDVEISAFAGDAKLQQAFAAGAVDMGIGSGPGMAFIAKGSPILAVAQEAGPPLGITVSVLASGPIHSIADLKGKLASISSLGSQTDWMVRELGRREGWGPDGIRTRRARRRDGAARRLCARIRSIWRRSTSPPPISSKRQARCAFS